MQDAAEFVRGPIGTTLSFLMPILVYGLLSWRRHGDTLARMAVELQHEQLRARDHEQRLSRTISALTALVEREAHPMLTVERNEDGETEVKAWVADEEKAEWVLKDVDQYDSALSLTRHPDGTVTTDLERWEREMDDLMFRRPRKRD